MQIFGRIRSSRLFTEAVRMLAKLRMMRSPDRKLLYRQIDRNLAHRGLDNAIIHSHRVLEKLWRVAGRDSRVLAVGACNLLEIHAFKSYGIDDVIGIDLVAPEKNDGGVIKIMDMHDLRFEDDTFDILYCSGAFHCSHDVHRLVREFVRVTKSGGYICIAVPVDFTPNDVYRYDVGSLENLKALFAPHVRDVVWSESVPANSEFNPNNNTTIRCIYRIVKERG